MLGSLCIGEEAPGLQSHLVFAGGGKVHAKGQEPEYCPAGHPQPCPGPLLRACLSAGVLLRGGAVIRERLETGPDAGAVTTCVTLICLMLPPPPRGGPAC